MIGNHDDAIEEAKRLFRANRTAYVIPEALKQAETILEMADDIEYLRHEYGRMLPIVAYFRQWRSGTLTDAQLLECFHGDPASKAISLEDWPWKRERDERIQARYRELIRPNIQKDNSDDA